MDFIDSRGNSIPLPVDAHIAWRVSGYALVQDANDRYLMVQAGDGRWQFPGGGIEQHESISDGIIRECQEETGYTVTLASPTPVHIREQHFYHTREQAFYRSLQLFYRATLASSEPNEAYMTERDKARERRWIALADVAIASVHPSIVEVITHIQQQKTS